MNLFKQPKQEKKTHLFLREICQMTQEDKGYSTTKIQEPEALVGRKVGRLFESLFK